MRRSNVLGLVAVPAIAAAVGTAFATTCYVLTNIGYACNL